MFLSFNQSTFSLFTQTLSVFLVVRLGQLINLTSRSLSSQPIETHHSPFAFFTANSMTAELTDDQQHRVSADQ